MRSTFLLLPILVLASGCASSLSSQCLPEPARVASRADGVPETFREGRARLLKLEPKRYCQALVEAPFSTDHAVWFTYLPSRDAQVFVSVMGEPEPEVFEAPLDENLAGQLERACRAFLASSQPRCGRNLRDGETYHVAHYEGDAGYSMRSFRSPRRGTIEEKFVRVLDALRTYGVVPKDLRSVYWGQLQEAVSELQCALGSEEPWCSYYSD